MQVYVVVWQKIGGFLKVLVAKKKERGARFGGQATAPSILNYAGQWVFPGGKVEDADTPEQAARREFLEETGHGLKWDVKGSRFSSVDRHHGILYVESANIDLMATQINQNLSGNSTSDDELERVSVFTDSYALALFSIWAQQSQEVEDVLMRRTRYYKDRSWFTNALQKLE